LGENKNSFTPRLPAV